MKRERITQISLDDVGYKYQDGTEIFKNINYELPLGKCVALQAGPGSGKSLLLKILAGLLDPKSGAVLYNGKNINEMTFEDFVPMRLSTSICFENGGLLMNKTLEDNLKLSLLYHKQWRTERSPELFEQLTEDFRIQGFLHLRPAQVSEGVRRIAGIVRTFLTNPQVVFLDEPSLGIGERATDMLKTWINKHRKEFEDATIFLTTQDAKLIEGLDAEKMVLQGGLLKKAS